MKKVKVVSCSDKLLWYNAYIGQTFDVYFEDAGSYWVNEPSEHYAIRNLIFKHHAVEVLEKGKEDKMEIVNTEHIFKVDSSKVPEVKSCKDTNPKDAIGVTKAPMSVLPMQVVYEAALGMYEGALKYGAFNYRIAGVRASVYYDAIQRHLNQWWEGEDIDPDSNISHVTKAITALMVMRDAMLNDKFNDDRPPKVLDQSWMKNYNEKVKQLQVKYPAPVPRYTWKGNQ